MALPQPQPRQQHHQQQQQHPGQHARQLSRLNMTLPGVSSAFAEPPLFTPHGQSQYPQFSQSAQPGPQSAFALSTNHMQQHQQQHPQRQLGHGHQASMSMHRSRPSLAGIPGFMPGGPMTAGPNMPTFNPYPIPPTPGSQQQQFAPQHAPTFRSRRNQSISIGGPPKAALGGPQRKAVSPVPGASPTPVTTDVKQKKVAVKFPRESEKADDAAEAGDASGSQSRSLWSRTPLVVDSSSQQPEPLAPETISINEYSTAEVADGDSPANNVTVGLPRRNAWEAYRASVMEEKLAKLGVEPAGFVGPPLGHLPSHLMMHHHNRASSVSTPADPALLNRHAMQGTRQTPSPLAVPHPMSAVSTPGGPGFGLQQQPRGLAPPFSFAGANSPHGGQPFGPAPPLVPRGYHGHSMSLAAPSYSQPNPYLSPGFSMGSSNPFGSAAVLGGDSSQGAPSLSVSPQPGTSLASVSEYDEVEEEGASAEPKIHAPKPRGMLHLRPVFVSQQSSPAPSVSADAEFITPPVTAVAPAKTLTSVDFMRGFGIDSDEEEQQEEVVPVTSDLVAPIVDEVQRDRLIAEEETTIPTPTAGRFPTDALSEGEIIEDAVNAVDPAEDADEEDASNSDDQGEELDDGATEPENEGDVRDDGDDGFTTPSHSRHVSKVSMAPSLAEMGPTVNGGAGNARGMKEFRFGGTQEVEEEDGDDASMEASAAAARHFVSLNDEMDAGNEQEWTGTDDYQENVAPARLVSDEDEDVGEWSNPSDEERARAERRVLRDQARRHSGHYDQDTTLHSQQSFISNPSNDGHRSEDIVSNPSDDDYGESREYGDGGMTFGGNRLAQAQRVENPYYAQVAAAVVDVSPAVQRPLPPLPHSREQSYASPTDHHHSPANSMNTPTPLVKGHHSMLSATSATRSDLNPLARPFVFGARPGSNSFNLQSPSTEPGSVPPTAHGRPHQSSHSRQVSLATKLNVTAPEFKPTGGFAFTPITGVPTMPFPPPVAVTPTPRPLPQPPTEDGSPFPAQGREKRQRVVSDDEKSSRPDFQFPGAEKPSEAAMERRGSILNVNAKPFNFSGAALPSLKPTAPAFEPGRSISFQQTKSEQQSPVRLTTPQLEKAASMPASALGSPPPSLSPQVVVTTSPVQQQAATTAFGRVVSGGRMPIPDFSHPVSLHTVPAGLFKALQADGDGPTRSSVRSRLGSRDFMEHASRRSLDDLNVPSISKKMAPKPAMTLPPAPAPAHVLPKSGVPLLALAPPPRAKERRSSAPSQPAEVFVQALREPSPSGMSEGVVSSTMGRRDDLDHLESRIEEIIDDKISQIREDISSLADVKGQASDGVVNAAISQLVSSFRTQMMEYMKKVAETNMSRADAHVELDFDLIKAAIDEGHQTIRTSVQKDLSAMADRINSHPAQRPLPPIEVLHAIEDLRSAVTETMNAATQTMLSHADDANGYAQRRVQEERQMLIRDLSAMLLPRLAALRPEPMDVDLMTQQLSEAVKPHISQLIDLASDKKETAVLIVQQLVPMLHALTPPRLDVDAIAAQLAMDVVRLAPPTDPHVLKEQVADLVIERLDSRLAIRDGTLNPDAIATRVSKILGPLSELSNLPSAASVEALNKRQDDLFARSDELAAQQSSALGKLDAVPESIISATEMLKAAHDELSTKSKFLGELEELKQLATTNADLQVQLGKARNAHGQARSEKDVLSQRLQTAEQDRERMRAEIDALKAAAATRDTDIRTMEAQKIVSDAALSQAQDHAKASEDAANVEKTRAAAAEERAKTVETEVYQLQTRVEVMELAASVAARDLEASAQAKAALEEEVSRLRDHTKHFDEIRRTADRVEKLAQLIDSADSDEIVELKRIRDRSQALGQEHSALQKRCADQEAKIAALQRTNAASKHAASQAEQTAERWQKQAESLEDDLENAQSQLEQASDLNAQIEGDVVALKDEVETGLAAMKVAGEREQQLQNKIATLESQLLSVQAELKEARDAVPAPVLAPRPQAATASTWQKAIAVPNGRPGSAASDISRPGTVTPNGRGSPASPDTPPAEEGLWASMHAPKTFSTPATQKSHPYTPKRAYSRHAAPSPTPSAVSTAATEQEDGWWA